MPADFSFDIVSRVDKQEVRNAMDQAIKELTNRYDFKGSKSEIQFEKEEITLIGDDEFKLGQVRDIVESKLLKRGIDIRQIDYSKPEPATGMTLKQKVILKQGISQDHAKPLIKQIKDAGIKVQAQIQGEEIRVSGKSKDDLQKAIQFVKGLKLDFPVEFVNYR
ncbi:MAG TPA: YajQ family cyclic di-GMP-binding protein [Fimbriimonadaceae bacterium]|mgnify:CR=1 FL=1|nr:YajQ family cyclic di-GMP-binding protein [Fimbriimonadaceae bacterium]HRJ34302.1 YajQ family cyclic di-GMP-binding protein [Fimbriimonadaceae bacterium]